VPILLFVITALLATTFAVLATRPRVTNNIITSDDVKAKKSTLLFFGSFTSLPLKDFEDSMLTILRDDEYLYRCILADFHGQGMVLKRKYKFLRYSYTVFLVGIILSILAFLIAQFQMATV
ncbi:MAG: Pycsar system effector family protein, partial [Flavobacteriales bacterium]